MKRLIDDVTGRVTMYRLVLISLSVMAVWALGLSAIGELAYELPAMLFSLATLVVATLVFNRLFALMFGVRTHTESSVITALLLFFIFAPSDEPQRLLELALAALFAAVSKYLVTVRGRHIFNPAAVGAFYVSILGVAFSAWWVATPPMLPITLLAGVLILYRTRRLELGAVFLVVAAVVLLVRGLFDGAGAGEVLWTAVSSFPLVFFACFMLSEPLTLPPLRWQQLGIAAGVAVVVAVPITIFGYYLAPEAALLIGNAVAFAFGQRRRIELTLDAKKTLTATSYEFSFTPTHAVDFRPGQYMELSLPHQGADSRGFRRVFSIASEPVQAGRRGAIRFGVKIPEKASSFKRALAELPPGTRVNATLVAGEFLLPKDESVPILMIAGGIGITPFVSHLRSMKPGSRDVTVIYAVSSAKELGYVRELQDSGARVFVVSPQRLDAVGFDGVGLDAVGFDGAGLDAVGFDGAGLDAVGLNAVGLEAAGVGPVQRFAPGVPTLPSGWEQLAGDKVSVEALRSAVPDIAGRQVYVSGPPAMVDEMAAAAAALKARRVKTDYFVGY